MATAWARRKAFGAARGVRGSIVCLLVAMHSASAQSDDAYKIIVNVSVPIVALNRHEVSDLFLKKTPKWPDGMPVVPVDLAEESRVRQRFTTEIHGRSVPAITAYWYRKIYSGRSVPPVEVRSAEEVMMFVRSRAGAIGYVPATMAAEGVKVVKISE